MMRPKYLLASFILVAISALFLASTTSAKELSDAEFYHTLWKERKYLFVFFYSAKNCDNCLPLLLIWVKFGQMIASSYPDSKLVIGHVNCDRQAEFCTRIKILNSGVSDDEESVSGDEEEEDTDQPQLQLLRRPLLKLYLKPGETLSQLYLKDVLALDPDEEEEATGLTEVPYKEETIDLPHLELFLRRHLPKYIIEGPMVLPVPKFFSESDPKDESMSGGRVNGHFSFDDSKADNTEPSASSRKPARNKGFIDLTDENFVSSLAQGDNLVYFYTPKCKYCQGLKEHWHFVFTWMDEALHSLGVRLFRINCAAHSDVCEYFDVKGVPEVIWLSDGYIRRRLHGLGGMSIQSFVRVIDSVLDEIEQRSKKKKAEWKEKGKAVVSDDDDKKHSSKSETVDEDAYPTETMLLNSENFYSTIKSGGGDDSLFFVHYTVPWSRHCRGMILDWHRLQAQIAQSRQLRSAVRLARVDCSKNEPLCDDEKVDGYPTLTLYQNGKRLGEYEGSRTANDFLAYLQAQLSEKSSSASSDSASSSSSSSKTEGVTENDSGGGSSHSHPFIDEL